MPRQSKSYSVLSDAALGSLTQLGGRLKEARLRRNWSQQQTAEKAGLSESSIKKVEAGSPRITVGAYLSLLDVFGMPTALDQVLAQGSDSLGEALARSATRRRAGTPRKAAGDDEEWEI
jgi:transcriptional regulator with XRE-family HTH domain